MSIVDLTPWDLSLAAALVLGIAALAWWQRLAMARTLVVAATRMTLQLLLIGMVLRWLFAQTGLAFVALLALVMLFAAGREIHRRAQRSFVGGWGYTMGTGSLALSSFPVLLLALAAIVQPTPWYKPQYAIPLLGMLFGNTMTGIALALDRLTDLAWSQRATIEQRLALGANRHLAIEDIRRTSLRAGLIPIINAMSAAGIVSLPGMMTGQILAGSPPIIAVKYQILIMFLIATGTALGTICAVLFGAHRLFDDRHRLRLDRLGGPRNR